MRVAESRLGAPLERTLALSVTERGKAGTAVYLGVSKGTITNWMCVFGIQVRRVALRPGEHLRVVRPDGGTESVIRNSLESA